MIHVHKFLVISIEWIPVLLQFLFLHVSSICISRCIKRFVTVIHVLIIIRTAVPLQVKRRTIMQFDQVAVLLSESVKLQEHY